MSTDNAKDLIAVTLTKEQWEEVYQWYLVCKEDYNLKDYEHLAGRTIASTLIGKYGSFN